MPRSAPEPRRQPERTARRFADTADRRRDEEREAERPQLIVPRSPAIAPASPAPQGSHKHDVVPELIVKDLATLRVLADPLRLAILGAFGDGRREHPMTVKEIAERIDEGPTKLYRHIKQLEDAGLLAVAGTRLVSGILEKSYRPVYRRIDVDDDLLNLPGQQDEYLGAISALLESSRMRLLNEMRAGSVLVETPDEGPDLSLEVNTIGVNLRVEQYDEVHAKLTELMELLVTYGNEQKDDPEAVPVRFQVVLYPLLERTEGGPDAGDGGSA
ncbi:MAG TPA: helix-turn-helix domain-containing protein [Actinocrinis sp.]